MLYFKNGRLLILRPSFDLLWSCELVPDPGRCRWGVGVGVGGHRCTWASVAGGGGTSGLLAACWAPGVPTTALTQAASLSLGPASPLARWVSSGPRVVGSSSSGLAHNS